MEDMIIHCNKGVGDVFFGMSPNEVKKRIGIAESEETVGDGERIREQRGGISYYYENKKLMCITSPLEPQCFWFILDGKKLPYSLVSAVKFLKTKSTVYVSVPEKEEYIFLDLGIVLYPFVAYDMEAGIKVTNHYTHISICNQTISKRYYSLFVRDKCNSIEI